MEESCLATLVIAVEFDQRVQNYTLPESQIISDNNNLEKNCTFTLQLEGLTLLVNYANGLGLNLCKTSLAKASMITHTNLFSSSESSYYLFKHM